MNTNFQPENKGTILLVDDIPDNLRLLSEILRTLNYTVRCVTSGKMALKSVKINQPELILLDIKMPEMDGYQVCQMLKKDEQLRDIPVIFISALDDTLDKVKAFKSGGNDYIIKPFQLEEVVNRIENQLIIQRQKRYQITLKELSDQLKLALKSGDIGVWEWNIINNKLTWDEKIYELYGLNFGAETSYQIWENALHPEDKDSTILALQSALKANKEFDFSFRIIQPNGKVIFLKSSALIERDQNNQPIKMIGLNYDITQQKEAEELLYSHNKKLILINQELEKISKLKDDFLANMSHELRTPLNNILGMAEILEEQIYGPLNEKQLKSINNIYRHGQHLLELINDILDLAKIESGKMQLEYSLTPIVTLCQDSLSFINQIAYQKHIQVIKNINPEINSAQLDKIKIRQALINLLSNAVKFTPEGGKIILEVTKIVETDIHKKWLKFSVIDTGIGIANENIKRLFQSFVQLDTGFNRQHKGTGLGLSLVKKIAELHKGKVTVESIEGKGSCFSILIPFFCWDNKFWSPQNPPKINLVKDRCNLKLGAKKNKIQSEKIENQPDNLLILIVEDDDSHLITLTSYLEAKGYQIITAKNGLEALEILKITQPNLILMDISLPEMDGLETMRLIRSQPTLHKIPIIVTTALAMENDRQKCLQAGANQYLTKPLRFKELVDKIKELLN